MASTKFGKVEICRSVSVPIYRFIDYFKGFETVDAVKQIFGDETAKILSELKVEFFSFGSARALIGVNDHTGHLFMNADYLTRGDVQDIYLDVIHELVHVKQFLEGRPLHGVRFEYIDNPTEIEAYRHTIAEAKRIGLSNEEIYEYLKVDWITEGDAKKLAKTLGIEVIS